MTRVSKIVRALRRDLSASGGKLSQQTLADLIGCSRRTINVIEKGHEGVGLAVALKIEMIFNYPAEKIVIAQALDALDKERKNSQDGY